VAGSAYSDYTLSISDGVRQGWPHLRRRPAADGQIQPPWTTSVIWRCPRPSAAGGGELAGHPGVGGQICSYTTAALGRASLLPFGGCRGRPDSGGGRSSVGARDFRRRMAGSEPPGTGSAVLVFRAPLLGNGRWRGPLGVKNPPGFLPWANDGGALASSPFWRRRQMLSLPLGVDGASLGIKVSCGCSSQRSWRPRMSSPS